MPRGKKRTTQSGAPAQSVRSVPGQRYGESREQQLMQRALPAPDNAAATSQALAVPSPAGQPATPATPGYAPLQPPSDDQIMGMLAQAPLGLLSGTQRPNEPVTAGMPMGPGAGPRPGYGTSPTQLSRWYSELYRRTGDPLFREIAERARL